ncbi:MAG: lipid A deacylase LpxR family protein [Phycisphaeraceae bacterium]
MRPTRFPTACLGVAAATLSPIVAAQHSPNDVDYDRQTNRLMLAMLLDDDGKRLIDPDTLDEISEHINDHQDPRPGTVRIYWENDGFAHDPFDSYDRHYTNGFAIVLEHQPAWADALRPYMPFAELFAQAHGEADTGAGYVLSQLLFTPDNLSATAPIPTDQPYAGYLYGGVFWQRQAGYRGRDDVAVFDHFEVNVGVVGDSSLGEDIHEGVHDLVNGIDPKGWDNQLADEVTGQFYYRRKWRIDLGSVDLPWLEGLDMQVIPQAGLALGSVYRYADAAATFRIGYQLPDDFGPGRINDLQSASGDAYHNNGWSWYVYGRVGGRAVQHDLFLDGSNTDDPSLSVDKEPLVGELQGGFAISYRPNHNHRFDLTWGLTYTTDTFDAPGNRGTDSYGTFVISWVKTF